MASFIVWVLEFCKDGVQFSWVMTVWDKRTAYPGFILKVKKQRPLRPEKSGQSGLLRAVVDHLLSRG